MADHFEEIITMLDSMSVANGDDTEVGS
jgi:hypothetical protein